jgi:hypothetical protein
MRAILVVFGWLLVVAPSCLAQGNGPDGVSALIGRLEQAIRSGDPNAYIALLSQNADRARAAEFAAQAIGPRVTRAVIRERDRMDLQGTLQGDGYQLLVEVLIEYGQRARLTTWRLDVRRRGAAAAGAADQWGIQDQQVITSLGGLYRLSLNPTKQYAARDLVITSEDLQLTVEQASVFVAETDAGMTALKRIKANTAEKRLLNARGEPNFNINFYILNTQGQYAGVTMYGGKGVTYSFINENGAQTIPLDPLLPGEA